MKSGINKNSSKKNTKGKIKIRKRPRRERMKKNKQKKTKKDKKLSKTKISGLRDNDGNSEICMRENPRQKDIRREETKIREIRGHDKKIFIPYIHPTPCNAISNVFCYYSLFFLFFFFSLSAPCF